MDDGGNAKETNSGHHRHHCVTQDKYHTNSQGPPLLIVITVSKKFNLALFAY